jgi:hypothetical protein
MTGATAANVDNVTKVAAVADTDLSTKAATRAITSAEEETSKKVRGAIPIAIGNEVRNASPRNYSHIRHYFLSIEYCQPSIV